MTAADDSIREKVRATFANVLEVEIDEVTDYASFYEDLGGDSLQKLDLVVALEDEFSVKLTDEEVAHLNSVCDVAARLQREEIT